jgi:hypothetical protein
MYLFHHLHIINELRNCLEYHENRRLPGGTVYRLSTSWALGRRNVTILIS